MMRKTLDQLIGQLIIAGFRSDTISGHSTILKYIEAYNLSGVILYDGELALKKEKQPKEIKDCFEKLNRATFAFNQGLDKAIIKPIAKGYRNLPDPVQKGTRNAVRDRKSVV